MTQNTFYEPNQPCVAGLSFIFPVFLFQRSNSQLIQTSPTLAVGDVKISRDGGGFSNITSLPIEVGTTGELTVNLSTLETTGSVNYITVKFSDVAGEEWCDVVYSIDVEQPEIINLDNLDVAVSTRSTLTAAQVWSYVTRTITAGGITASEIWSYVTRTLTAGGGGGGATAADIWTYNTRTLTDASGLASSIWEYENRTLTSWRQIVIDIWKAIPNWFVEKIEQLSEMNYVLYRGSTNSISVIGSTNISGSSNIVFTIKNKYTDSDSASILRIELLNGLTLINGEPYPTSTDGSIDIIDETSGNINIILSSIPSSLLIPSLQRVYDIKAKVGNEVKLVSRGKIDILPDVTNTI